MRLFQRIVLGLGLTLFAVCCGAVLIAGRSAFGWQLLNVPTGSMRPAVQPGSLVLVHRIPTASLQVGDVITYANPLHANTTITHRIVKISRLGSGVAVYITKGDANARPDPVPVLSGLIQGKVLKQAPHFGSVLTWSKTWLAIGLFVYLPALILMIDEVRRLAMYFRSLMPYRLWGYRPIVTTSNHGLRYAAGAVVSLVVFVSVGLYGQSALALLQSNTVSLTNNQLVALGPTTLPPGSSTNCTNNTNVTANSSSNQTATSGNASSSNTTTGGSVTSGSASNSNATGINITVTGC